MFSNKICNMQTHPFKEHVEKMSTNLPILVSKITNENTKILLPLDEQDHMLNHGEINIQIYKKHMGLCEDIYFEFFLLDLKIDEETCGHILGI
jgi:hypothetical protein